MRDGFKNSGSVVLMVVFVVALLSVLVIGILQMNTEEIQLMRNRISAAEALAIAEAGLNDAFAEIRADSAWSVGFSDKPFIGGGSYTVEVTNELPNPTIRSTGTTAEGFVASMETDVTVGVVPPYVIRIDKLRVNE